MSGQQEHTLKVGITTGPGFPSPEPYGEGLALWRDFSATVDYDEWPIIDLGIRVSDRTVHLEEVTFRRRPEADSLKASSLRVPLAQILQYVIEVAVMKVTETAPGSYKITPVRDGDHGSLDAAISYSRRQPRGARRVYTNTEARKALSLYRKAKKSGQKNPFGWVGNQLHVSRSAAYAMVKHADSLKGVGKR